MSVKITVVLDQSELLDCIYKKHEGSAIATEIAECELQILYRGCWVPVGANDNVGGVRFATKGER